MTDRDSTTETDAEVGPDAEADAMTQTFPVWAEELLTRLRGVLQAREVHRKTPAIQYCLECDDYILETWGDDGLTRLDCRHDHFESIIEETRENAEISAWVTCLEHVKARVDGSAATTHKGEDTPDRVLPQSAYDMTEVIERRDLDWPRYFVSGEQLDADEGVPAYFRVAGPNGPVSYCNPNHGPYPTTMFGFTMEAQSNHFREVSRDETPWPDIEASNESTDPANGE